MRYKSLVFSYIQPTTSLEFLAIQPPPPLKSHVSLGSPAHAPIPEQQSPSSSSPATIAGYRGAAPLLPVLTCSRGQAPLAVPLLASTSTRCARRAPRASSPTAPAFLATPLPLRPNLAGLLLQQTPSRALAAVPAWILRRRLESARPAPASSVPASRCPSRLCLLFLYIEAVQRRPSSSSPATLR